MSDRRTAEERAEAAAGSVETLLEALPYIREFHGRTVVIKYGGAAMRDKALRDDFARDVVLLKYVGLNPVIVHGGGPEITEYMERLGLEVKFVEGLRVSDAATVEVAKMVLLGKVNSDIVQRLNRQGQPAVGLSGEDGTLFEIRPGPQAEKVGFVGEIERVDVDVLNHIKTALLGHDPNWGRIAQAAGMALAGEELPELGAEEDRCGRAGLRLARGEYLDRPRQGRGLAHVYFSDLSHGYVELNAEYTT